MNLLSRVILLCFLASVQGEYIGNDGVITFWGDPNFKGEKWEIHRTLDPQYCYNDNVGKPSSITWKNQITKGKMFGGKAKIAFYNKNDCKGLCLAWPTSTKDFPANLEADHFDNQIKSFMIWQSDVFPDVIVRDVRRLRRVEGVLNFWDGPNFTGEKLRIHGSVMGQTCYNANAKQPTSITWENLPTTGFFDGKAKIAFYEDKNCVGTWRAWFSTEKDFPTNVKLDGLNGIQSFMLWQLNKEPRVYKQLG